MQYPFQSFNLLNLDTDNIIAVSLCQRWVNINLQTKNTKRLSESCDTCYDLNPHKQFPRLNNHVTVHIQSKVINW